ncbi:16S rRNA (guanine(966)-N(2))-methyltransferase RsmD [Neisseria sp. 83E34]|uniref:16S rRNA (guanine(966)-N(2))-methyltransferase RsmD n=1 Tax=Neisseria sp. 83E34 TaxID=1692264 RepID=UPI0006CE98BC|nr:16S rRNA (guanine(966)-N(2))-methyltransferase RsmD [Neisseria sp. 83E34]KPN72255.1 lactate dehydrogenase [Neisseria sp. 83E34]
MSKHSKHTNQVRIIGGNCRGRKIRFLSAESLRPTADMVRERLFNWLGQDLTGLKVLDLFAGSGALGFEAASRNAKQVVMVEKYRDTSKLLQQNKRELGLEDKITISVQDALNYLKSSSEKFDVIFLDPPYAWEDWKTLFDQLEKCLSENAMIYIESASMPKIPEWLHLFREGKSGKSLFEVRIYKPKIEK